MCKIKCICFFLILKFYYSDLCAGLIGGLGVTPSGNIGKGGAVFESVSIQCYTKNCMNLMDTFLTHTMNSFLSRHSCFIYFWS